jgi:hypothetical protein
MYTKVDEGEYKIVGARARMWEEPKVPEVALPEEKPTYAALAPERKEAEKADTKLEGAQERAALPGKRPLEKDVRCPSCNSIVKAGETFCKACGEEEFGTG